MWMRAIAFIVALLACATAHASEINPARPLIPGLTGDTGILRVHSARTGVVGYWDIGGHGLYFQQKGFTTADDYNEFTGAQGSISWAPFLWLELYAASQIRENFNSTRDPNLDHANGALSAGAKLSLPIPNRTGPLWLAIKGGTRSPPNVDEIQFRPDTFGAEGSFIVTTDFTERGFPFRFHGNLGYIYDRSGVLIVPNENPARTFALDLSKYNRYTYGAGIELPFKYVTPFVEIWGAKPTDDAVKIEDSPGFVTPGLRVTPIQGLSLDIAYDIGLTRSIIPGLPVTPQRQLVFGASYAFASQTVHRAQFEESGELTGAAKQKIDELTKELEMERLAREAAESSAAREKAVDPRLRALWQIARDEANRASELERKLQSLDAKGAPVAERTGVAAATVLKAADSGETGDMKTAEQMVLDAEKAANAAALNAESFKGDPKLERPTAGTSKQARKAAQAARTALEKSKIIVKGLPETAPFRGLVLDAESFQPVGDAIVSFPDTNLSRLLADSSSGFFRSYPFPPGKVTVAVSKPGYETLLQAVFVEQGKDEVVRFLLKKEGGSVAANTPGVFKGKLVDEKGAAITGWLTFPGAQGVSEQEVEGPFEVKLDPGLYQVEAKAEGYLLQGRQISVGPGETATFDFVMRPVPKERRAESTGEKITLKDVINFRFNSDVIDKSSYSILDEVADVILSHPEFSLVRVEGHTDDVGSAAYNLSLSDRRARAVVRYLLEKGVPPEKMQAVGWGKAKPVSQGIDESARALNRRVEFNVIQQ